MNKHADFKFKLNDSLKEDFQSYCKYVDVTMSQQMRSLMRRWIEEMKNDGIKIVKKRRWGQ